MSRRDLKKAFERHSQTREEKINELSGNLGIAINGSKVVNVPNRKGFVFVRLLGNTSELIQAYNSEVAIVYDLPVKVQRVGGKWVVKGRDIRRYGDWGTSAYLPQHGIQHTFDLTGNGGGDVSWIRSEQFLPLDVFPNVSGTNLTLYPYTYLWNGAWKDAIATGTSSLVPYNPSGTSTSRMVLLYLDGATGNPTFVSGNPFTSTLSGIVEILPYIPTVSLSVGIPLYAIRRETGSTSIAWDEMYDLRQFYLGGTVGSGSSSSVAPVDPSVIGNLVSFADTVGAQADSGIAGNSVVVKSFLPQGSQEIINGDFDTDASGWILGAGWAWTASFDASLIHTPGDVEPFYQTGILSGDGFQYKANLYVGGTTGFILVEFGGGDSFVVNAGTGDQWLNGIWVDNGIKVRVTPSSDFDGEIEYLVMYRKEFLQAEPFSSDPVILLKVWGRRQNIWVEAIGIDNANWAELTGGMPTALHSHSGSSSDHESLAGLLGGTTNNHWHLTSPQITGLVSGTVTALHSHANDHPRLHDLDSALDHSGTLSAVKVAMPKLLTPILNTLKDVFTTNLSAGVADGTLTYITATGTQSVNVAAGEGYIRSTNDQQGDLYFCKWGASGSISIPTPAAGQETTRFIGIEYNGGNPQVTVRTTFNWNWYNDFPLARVSYDGQQLHILNAYAHSEDTANLTRKRFRLTLPFSRENSPEGTGGLELSEINTRQLSMSGGNIWHGFNQYTIPAISTGTFDVYYRRSGGGFNWTGTNQYPNTQYDDGSGTLVTMTNNRYACLWVYLDVAAQDLNIIYGRNQYTSVAAAQLETTPTTPDHLTYHGRLIARIIFQKSSSPAQLIESAWATTFVGGAGAGNHEQLSGLLGGLPNDHYHLSGADTQSLTSGSSTGLHNHAPYNSSTFTGTNWTDLTDGGDSSLHYHQSDREASTANSGWNSWSGTVGFVSSDSPSFVVNITGNSSGTFGIGDKLQLTHYTNKFFFVTAYGGYFSGSFSQYTLYGGTDYALASSGTITSPFYSHVKSPFNFPTSPIKWTVTSSGTDNATKTNPSGSVWYGSTNAFTSGTALNISVPIGAWALSSTATQHVKINSGTGVNSVLTLSTTQASESDNELSAFVGTNGASGAMDGWNTSYKTKNILVAVKTTYYLLTKSTLASMNLLEIRGDLTKTIIRATCNYL